MLKRIYIDNFRCLVDFDLSFDAINLFVGRSGTGKSTVFEALGKVAAFASGDKCVSALFESDDLTQWQQSQVQRFELEIEAPQKNGYGGRYQYELMIHHDLVNQKVRVAAESLWFNNQPLLKVESGKIQWYRSDDSEGSISCAASDFSHSALAIYQEDDPKVTWFRERMKRFIIVLILPHLMRGESDQPEAQLSARMENFVSWYRHISQNQKKAHQITTALKKLFEGLDSFHFSEDGRVLMLSFSISDRTSEYRFDEMAEGQRVLIALYTLIYYARSSDITLCIDHSTHFIALPTIDSWLTLFRDFCCNGELQGILISHHPKVIDDLGQACGYWFDRDNDKTPVRVRRFRDEDAGGGQMSTMVARGWIFD